MAGVPEYPGDIVNGQAALANDVNVRSRGLFENLNPSVINGSGIIDANIPPAGLAPTLFKGGAVTTGGIVTLNETTPASIQTIKANVSFEEPVIYTPQYITGSATTTIDVSTGNVFVVDFTAAGAAINTFDPGDNNLLGQVIYIKSEHDLDGQSYLNQQTSGKTWTTDIGIGGIFPSTPTNNIWSKSDTATLALANDAFFCFVNIDNTGVRPIATGTNTENFTVTPSDTLSITTGGGTVVWSHGSTGALSASALCDALNGDVSKPVSALAVPTPGAATTISIYGAGVTYNVYNQPILNIIQCNAAGGLQAILGLPTDLKTAVVGSLWVQIGKGTSI